MDATVIAARRDRTVERLIKGLHGLVRKNHVDVHPWPRPPGGSASRSAWPRSTRPAQPTGEVILRAQDTILATGSRVKSLPGLVPDGARIVTSDDILRSSAVPASIIVVGAGAVGVEFASFYHDLGSQVTVLEYLPAIVPLEDAEVSEGDGARLHEARHQGHHQRPLRPGSRCVDESGVRLLVGQGGRGARGAGRGAAARGHRARRQHGRRGPRDDEGRRGAGHRQGGWPRCRPRSRTCTPSATSSAACGWPTSRRTRASPRSMPSPGRRSSPSTTSRCRARRTPGRRSPRSAAPGRVRAGRPPGQGGQVALPGQRQGHHQRRDRAASSRSSRMPRRTSCWACT